MNRIASRKALRQRLLTVREKQASGAEGDALAAAIAAHLDDVIAQLEPQCLGVYWPMRFEFNPRLLRSVDALVTASPTVRSSAVAAAFTLALPYCRRDPREMHFRLWDGAEPRAQDECRLPASDGARVVPDVVLAPCVGYTASGFRLGYGVGYFDRWLAANPHATVIGIASSGLEIDEAELAPEAHDLPMTLIVTERGVAA